LQQQAEEEEISSWREEITQDTEREREREEESLQEPMEEGAQ
jgi:hypothetical protein